MGIPIIGDIIGAVKGLVSEVVVDKDKKNELLVRLKELEDKTDERFHQELMGQIEVNKVEAAHPSIFVAGWRPAVGWISAIGLGWQFVLSPFAETIARWSGWLGQMPAVDTESLMMLVLGMLGIGAQRSFEKFKGVETTVVKRQK
jgi:uncharacterized membrane protein (DUF106 family)